MGRTNAIIGTKLPELTTPAGAADVLFGQEAIDAGGAIITGTMPDNADADVEISDLAGTLIPAGRYDGTGRAKLTAAEAAKVISGHLLAGVTLMGVPGDSNVVNTASGDAVAGDITTGKKAWVKGIEVTGDRLPALDYASQIQYMFHSASGLPTYMKIVAPNATNIIYLFYNAAFVGDGTVELTANDSVANMLNTFYSNGIKHVILHFSTAHVTNFRWCFAGSIITITGEIDFSSVTDANNVATMLHLSGVLTTISLKPSSLGVSIPIHSQALTDTSLLSIANGIVAGSGMTLTLNTIPYTRCGTMTVYVSGGVAYAADPGGGTPMTLAAFITGAAYKNSTLASE